MTGTAGEHTLQTWYELSRWDEKIKARDFVRSTDKTLFDEKGRRHAIETSYERWFPTLQEAEAALNIRKQHKADQKAALRLHDAAPDLLRELEAVIPRFIRCMIATGTDPEYAEGAVESARAAIAKARGAA